MAEATRKAAQAQALYKDALNDTNSKLQAQIALQQALSNERTAGLKLELEQARTAEQVAKARGDENAAIQAQIQQKRIEKQIRAESANAARDEADAIIKAAEAEMREGQTTGTITPLKKQELEARIANARAKKIEAATTDESIRQIDSEIDKTKELINVKQELNDTGPGGGGSGGRRGREGGGGRDGGGGSSNGASQSRYSRYGSNASWRDDNGDLRESGSRGATRAVNRTAMQELQQKKKLGILSADDLQLAEAALKTADYNNTMIQNLGAGWVEGGGRQRSQEYFNEVRQMYDEVKAMATKGEKSTSATPASTQPYQQDLGRKTSSSTTTPTASSAAPIAQAPPAPTAAPAPSSSSHTLTLNISSVQGTFHMGSEEESIQLKRMLQQALKEAGRAA